MNDIEQLNLEKIHTVYFIGIGGIGMSALARFFKQKGAEVYGYDKVETTLTKKLVEEGLKIHYVDDPKMVPENVDLVVYTPAIPDDHLEKNWFLQNGYELYKRAKVLGLISKSYKTIAVAGTHGKTTTSTLVTHLLRESGIDCTAFLGGISKDLNGNFVKGSSDWLVVEADEFDRSFLHLHPTISVVLSMDADHLDIYGHHDYLIESFEQFVNQTKREGLVVFKEDLNLRVEELKVPYLRFGEEKADCQYSNVKVENGSFVFDFKHDEDIIENIRLALPGRHNIENACAALSVGLMIGADKEKMKKALDGFKGIHRRFEMIYRDKDVAYIDDYAHHPTELKAVISAARELFPGKKITGVFQPHLFSRTKDFLEGFIEALDELDEVFLLDIYPARENPIQGINSSLIAEGIKNQKAQLLSKDELLKAIENWNGQILMTLGAGDIDQLVLPIKQILENKK